MMEQNNHKGRFVRNCARIYSVYLYFSLSGRFDDLIPLNQFMVWLLLEHRFGDKLMKRREQHENHTKVPITEEEEEKNQHKFPHSLRIGMPSNVEYFSISMLTLLLFGLFVCKEFFLCGDCN